MKICAVAAMLLLCHAAGAQDGAAAAQGHLQTAFEAYNEHDYAGFTASLETATQLNRHSLATRYYLARGYALTGRPDDALTILEELARKKVNFGYAQQKNLESLHDNPRFVALLAQLEIELTPILNASHRHTIDQLGIIPEGIAIDQATNRTFLSSMRSGDILVLDAANSLSKFATVRNNRDMAAIGLVVDTPRNLLWAVGATFEMTENYDPDAKTETGVFGFDLSSGELKEKYLAGDVAEFFNDLAVAADGTIYISGSDLSVVAPGTNVIEKLHTNPALSGTNGIAVSADGKRLFVSSYPVGIAVINLQYGDSHFLALPEDTTLYGVDGLYSHEGDLVAVQNGVEPWRLVRISMDENLTAVTDIRFIEFANPDIGPTTGAIVGDVIHLVGQGPAPDVAPSQFAENLLPFLGKTVLVTVPLN